LIKIYVSPAKVEEPGWTGFSILANRFAFLAKDFAFLATRKQPYRGGFHLGL